MPLFRPLEERFWEKVQKGAPNDCWPWTGATNPHGYGKIRATHPSRYVWPAYRLSYALNIGPIPSGLCVLHRCDNPSCVNPAHLFLGTHKDNTHDAIAKGRFIFQVKKTHCPQGHAYTPANTYIKKNAQGCLTCRRKQDLVYYYKRRHLASS